MYLQRVCALELCAFCSRLIVRIYFHVFRELFRSKFVEGMDERQSAFLSTAVRCQSHHNVLEKLPSRQGSRESFERQPQESTLAMTC